MTDQTGNGRQTPTAEELRAQVVGTREELGQTVEALAAKTDIKAQVQQRTTAAREKAAEVGHRAQDKATLARDRAAEVGHRAQDKAAHAKGRAAEVGHRAQDKATHALEAARDKTPEPLREKTTEAASAVNRHRGLVLGGAAALALAFVLWRGTTKR
ncbi:DUF3618 domain-containing protein [Streptomyces sp. JL2001]|uniref:DUF3618 domain-containing protein n=1 Tax=Streptomyces sp. JL2001 TaxID=3342488 RepID=UPI003D804AF8